MNKTLLLERIQDLTNPLSPVTVDYQKKLTSLSGIKCVSLDFYGTMFISGASDIGIEDEKKEKSIRCIQESLEEIEFTIKKKNTGERAKELLENTINAHITAGRNNGVDYPEADIRAVWWDVLSRLLDEEYISGNLTKESALRFGVEYEFRMNAIWPSPNLASLLQSLLDHGLTLGIISNSQYYTPLAFEALLEQSPQKFGFHSDLLFWSFKTGYKKPSQNFYHLYLEAAAQKDIDPHHILYIGNDIHKDIYPAKTLGMKTGLYIGDKRSIRHEAEDLKQEKYQPDLIIDDLQQISECLKL